MEDSNSEIFGAFAFFDYFLNITLKNVNITNYTGKQGVAVYGSLEKAAILRIENCKF